LVVFAIVVVERFTIGRDLHERRNVRVDAHSASRSASKKAHLLGFRVHGDARNPGKPFGDVSVRSRARARRMAFASKRQIPKERRSLA
jgi:hypothetical protein